MHPNKSHLLFSKWKGFLEKIVSYYYLHIKDKRSKEVLTNSKNTTEQNSLDYIHTILLNSVILPNARFSDKRGKNSKKISIPDANESFIVHLTTINDYEKVISELKEKYYNRSLTIQPFIIVVGHSIYNLEKFYVYFDKTLLKCDSFLKSLDICFKIIYTLSLEYPKGCQGPWLFIQEYFYEIKPINDNKLSAIYSLLNFLKT
ncbi:uncharacterized protein LOC124419370 [Lucilia cuprina]|nr:uncharacterized protein LOC124419370 [Lucilia cuprina]